MLNYILIPHIPGNPRHLWVSLWPLVDGRVRRGHHVEYRINGAAINRPWHWYRHKWSGAVKHWLKPGDQIRVSYSIKDRRGRVLIEEADRLITIPDNITRNTRGTA